MTQRFSVSAEHRLAFAFGPRGPEAGGFEQQGPDARPDYRGLNELPRNMVYNRVDGLARMRVGTIANNPYYRDYPPVARYNFGNRIGPMVSSLAAQRGYQRMNYGMPYAESPNQMRAARLHSIINARGGSAVIGSERVPNYNPLMRDPLYDPRDLTRLTKSSVPSVAAFSTLLQKDQAKYLRRGDYKEMYRINQIADNAGQMESVWLGMRDVEQEYAGKTPLSTQKVNVLGWNVNDQLQILVEKGQGEYDYIQHKPYSAVQFEDWKQGRSLRIMKENGIVIKMKVRMWMEGVKPFPESVTVEFHKPGTYYFDGRKIVVKDPTKPDAAPEGPVEPPSTPPPKVREGS